MPETYRIEARSPVGVRVTLYDGELTVLKRGVTRLQADQLKAGLYLLSFRGPGSGRKEYVRVGPEHPVANVEFSASDLAAPVLPVKSTRRSQGHASVPDATVRSIEENARLQEQLKAIYEVLSEPSSKAEAYLQRNDIIAGDLVISVRQSSGGEDARLLEQLQLESYRGSVMAGTHFSRRRSSGKWHRPWVKQINNIKVVPGFATGQLQLAPGVYRLRSRLGDHGRVTEQIFPVMWQRRTLVFTEYRRVTSPKAARPRIGIDPSRTIILTIPVTQTYRPEGDSVWIAASLLAGLARNGLSTEQTGQLCEAALATSCPCIALYALAAFQLRRSADGEAARSGSISLEEWDSFGEPLLKRALELPTPDAALMTPNERSESYIQTWGRVSPRIGAPPPLLAASWPKLMEAAARIAGLAPEDGFLDDVSRDIGTSGPWLTWTPTRRAPLPRDTYYLTKVAAAGRSLYEAWPEEADNSVSFDLFALDEGSDDVEDNAQRYEANQIALDVARDQIIEAARSLLDLTASSREASVSDGGPLGPLTGEALDAWLEDDVSDDDNEVDDDGDAANRFPVMTELCERVVRVVMARYSGREEDLADQQSAVQELVVLTGRPLIALAQDLGSAVNAFEAYRLVADGPLLEEGVSSRNSNPINLEVSANARIPESMQRKNYDLVVDRKSDPASQDHSVNTKFPVSIKNRNDDSLSELLQFITEHIYTSSPKNFIAVPGVRGFSSDAGTISLLVTFSREDGATEFLKFIAAKIFLLIAERNADVFVVELNGKEYQATADIAESEFVNLIEADLKLSGDEMSDFATGTFGPSFFGYSVNHSIDESRRVFQKLKGNYEEKSPIWLRSDERDKSILLVEAHESAHHHLLTSTPAGLLLWRLNQVISRDITWAERECETFGVRPPHNGSIPRNFFVDPAIKDALIEKGCSREKADYIHSVFLNTDNCLFIRDVFFGNGVARNKNFRDLTVAVLAEKLNTAFEWMSKRCDIPWQKRWTLGCAGNTPVFTDERPINCHDIAEAHAIGHELSVLRSYKDYDGFAQKNEWIKGKAYEYGVKIGIQELPTSEDEIPFSPSLLRHRGLLSFCTRIDLSVANKCSTELRLEEHLPWFVYDSTEIFMSGALVNAGEVVSDFVAAKYYGPASNWSVIRNMDIDASPSILAANMAWLAMDLQVYAFHKNAQLTLSYLLDYIKGDPSAYDQIANGSIENTYVIEYSDQIFDIQVDFEQIYGERWNQLLEMGFERFELYPMETVCHILNGSVHRNTIAKFLMQQVPSPHIIIPKIVAATREFYSKYQSTLGLSDELVESYISNVSAMTKVFVENGTFGDNGEAGYLVNTEGRFIL